MREPSRNVIEFRSGDVSSFWLLHTVSTSAAALMHYVRNPRCIRNACSKRCWHWPAR
jgi:predicted component of type VI protein secretion system